MSENAEKGKLSSLQGLAANIKKHIPEFVPLLGLIGVVVFFAAATKGLSISPFNLKILVNQVVILAVIATGSTFIFTMGAFDISLGALTSLASVLGILAANASGSVIVMLIVCIGAAVSISLANGACIAFFKLPSFIVTLATMSIMTAIVSLVIGTSSMITIEEDISYLDTTRIKITVLSVVIILSVFMFHYNKLGRSNKIIGGSPVVATQSGISIVRSTIATFFISGIGIGLGSFLLLARTGSVSAQTASSLAFEIIIAIVLGGMPISGGARSKITAAIIGASTITVLNNGLVILGMSTGALQAVRGVLFLVVVGLMVLQHREQYLPR
jgi:ribose transport system permease protein